MTANPLAYLLGQPGHVHSTAPLLEVSPGLARARNPGPVLGANGPSAIDGAKHQPETEHANCQSHGEILRPLRPSLPLAALSVVVCLLATPANAQRAPGVGRFPSASGTAGAVTPGQLEQSTPVTFAVSGINGNDANPCTVDAPCATIQRGLNVVPKTLYAPTVLVIDGGAYVGGYVENFINGVGPTSATDGGWFIIRGTQAIAAVDGGTSTGTSTASAQGSNATFGTLTDSNQAWVTNELMGRFIAITSGTQAGIIKPIVRNTGTVITIAGPWTTAPANGSAYEIRKNATIINTAVSLPAGPLGSGATASFAGFVVVGGVRSDMITPLIEQIDFNGIARGISVFTHSTFRIRRCSFTGTTTAGVQSSSIGNVNISESTSTTGAIFFSHSSAGPSSFNLQNNAVFSPSTFSQVDVGVGAWTGNFVYNASGSIYRFGNALDLSISGDVYDKAAGACVIGNMLANGFSTGSVRITNSVLNACLGGGVFVIGPAFVDIQGATLGAGLGSVGVTSSAGITLQDGARVRFASTVYLDGGSAIADINVDGIPYQQAAFRALGPPKNVTDAVTLSRIWEP